MLSTNENLVSSGYANGSLCSFKGFCPLPGMNLKRIKCNGSYVNSIRASQVDHIILQKWNQPDASILKLSVNYDTASVTMKDPIFNISRTNEFKLKQFQILKADAITGHKLQGLSKDRLVIADWDYSTPNWVYVVLSRVRTLEGVFLMKRLDEDKLKGPDPRLLYEENR